MRARTLSIVAKESDLILKNDRPQKAHDQNSVTVVDILRSNVLEPEWAGVQPVPSGGEGKTIL